MEPGKMEIMNPNKSCTVTHTALGVLHCSCDFIEDTWK